MGQHKAKVVHLRSNGGGEPPPPGGEPSEAQVQDYITTRVADLLLLAATLYGVDSATAGNEIVQAVVEVLEGSGVHVGKDIEPLRMLMEISEEIEQEIQQEELAKGGPSQDGTPTPSDA